MYKVAFANLRGREAVKERKKCFVSCPWFSKSDLFAISSTSNLKVYDLWSLLQMFLVLWCQLEYPLQEQHHDPPGNLKSFWEELGKFSLRQSRVSAPRQLGSISGLCKNPGMWRTLFWAPKKCQEALLRDSCRWHCCLGTWPSRVGQMLRACLSFGRVPASPTAGYQGLEEVGAAQTVPSALPRSLCPSAELIKG